MWKYLTLFFRKCFLLKIEEKDKQVLGEYPYTCLNEVGQFIEFIEKKHGKLMTIYEDELGVGCDSIELEFPKNNYVLKERIFYETGGKIIDYETSSEYVFLQSAPNYLKIFKLEKNALLTKNKLNSDSYILRHSRDFLLIITEVSLGNIPSFPMILYDYEGKLISDFKLIFSKEKEIEIFNLGADTFFFKQSDDELILINLLTYEVNETKEFVIPYELEILDKRRIFLCMYAYGIEIFNFKGSRLKKLYYSKLNTHIAYNFNRKLGIILINATFIHTRMHLFHNALFRAF